MSLYEDSELNPLGEKKYSLEFRYPHRSLCYFTSSRSVVMITDYEDPDKFFIAFRTVGYLPINIDDVILFTAFDKNRERKVEVLNTDNYQILIEKGLGGMVDTYRLSDLDVVEMNSSELKRRFGRYTPTLQTYDEDFQQKTSSEFIKHMLNKNEKEELFK